MIESVIWEDVVMGVGTIIGLYKKGFLASDQQTVMSRKATLPDTAAYAATSLAPLYSLELYFTFAVSLVSFAAKVIQYLYRAPKNEDLLGRKTGGSKIKIQY